MKRLKLKKSKVKELASFIYLDYDFYCPHSFMQNKPLLPHRYRL